jgi:hypothetical protein
VNTVYTQAAQLVATQISMQQTQTAMAVPPPVQNTPTLAPIFNTPTLQVLGGTPGSALTPFGVTPFATLNATLPPSGSGSTANGCNDSKLADETIPDKSVLTAGKEFTKVWEMTNTGTCSWEAGYVFTFLPNDSAPEIKGYDIVIKANDAVTLPDGSQSFVLKLTAPSEPGEYFGYWKMKDKDGNFFGERVYLDIIVE